MRALLLVSALLFALRMCAAARVGFGDSEALYASWAAHPQPAYLDHPGLVGVLARAIGGGGVPTPERAHVVTSVLATLVPWLVVVVARAAGAEKSRAASAGLVVACIPEIAVGLFGLTPDLLLAPAWLGAIGLAIFGLTRQDAPGAELRTVSALVAAGLLAGVAASAKVSGILLMLSLAIAYAQAAVRGEGDTRRVARSPWPWAGLAAGVVVVVPMILYETRLGFPMLRHRLVDTQHGGVHHQGPGFAFTNLGALVAGQLAYLSPLVAVAALLVGRDLIRRRHEDVASRILFCVFWIPLVPLTLLCLWSPVAEPHWIAPPLLALPIHAARRASTPVPIVGRRLIRAAGGSAAALSAAVHGWVLIPASASLMPSTVDPKTDIASELYGWPTAIASVHEQMRLAATAFDPEGSEVIVVGPHWTVCAQLHAALAGVRVGCATPVGDDFDRWLSRDVWRRAEHVLFVTDNRFPGDGAEELPAHVRLSQRRVPILRGGRTARVFELYLYSRRQTAARP